LSALLLTTTDVIKCSQQQVEQRVIASCFTVKYKAGKLERLEILEHLSNNLTLSEKSCVSSIICPLIYNAKSANQVARLHSIVSEMLYVWWL
jgi:hypothetical protein